MGNKEIKLPSEATEILREQKKAFFDKFGREPGPDDPIFFDPDKDIPTQLTDAQLDSAVLDGMKNAGTPPELVFAYKKTGRVVTESNMHLLSPADLAEWNAAVSEYFRLEQEAYREPKTGSDGKLTRNRARDLLNKLVKRDDFNTLMGDFRAGRRDFKPVRELMEAAEIMGLPEVRGGNEQNLDKDTSDGDANSEFDTWLNGPFVLEKIADTQFHAFLEGLYSGAALHGQALLAVEAKYEDAQVFLVQHNWAAAFHKAKDYGEAGSFSFPYPKCAFEFRISGKHVIVLTLDDGGTRLLCLAVRRPDASWYATPGYSFDQPVFLDKGADRQSIDKAGAWFGVLTYCVSQIRAACIALEAAVAISEVQRVPEKLNRARERRGKRPLFDYHKVSLTARRAYLSTENPASKSSVRLHFVRGHWRHLPNHKTWIKWHLRGDPDLGFIDKEYRL